MANVTLVNKSKVAPFVQWLWQSNALRKVGLGLLGVLAFLLLWQMLSSSGILKLPAPTKVVAETKELMLNPFPPLGVG